MNSSQPQKHGDLEKHFIKVWLTKVMTGCNFAGLLVRQSSGIWIQSIREVPTLESLELLDVSLDTVGAAGTVAVVMFPGVHSVTQLVETLELLNRLERWRVSTLDEDEDVCTVKVEWLTEEQKWSNCMGLAPLLSMPPTRRAPFVGLALWPGVQSRNEGPSVDFHDIPLPLDLADDDAARRQMFKQVKEKTTKLFAQTPERNWREISFCLPTYAEHSSSF